MILNKMSADVCDFIIRMTADTLKPRAEKQQENKRRPQTQNFVYTRILPSVTERTGTPKYFAIPVLIELHP